MKTKLFLSFFVSLSVLSLICGASEVQDVYLKTPDLSDESIIGYSVGIRPYRKSGIRVEAEKFDDKIIIHNYGYGGSGLTLCFGGAQEVLSMLKKREVNHSTSSNTIAVLGAGVIGLATAYDLLENGYEVHIYADQFSPHLTSDVAAGAWSPPSIPEDASEQQKQLIVRLIDISTRRMMLSATSAKPEFRGARIHTGYSFKLSSSLEKEKHKFGDDAVSEKEPVMVHFDNGVTKKGIRKRALGLDGKLFMEDLYAKVLAKGAIVYHKHFSNKKELKDLAEKVIINCTSFGSQKLFDDQDFLPIRGQMVYFKVQPGIDYTFYQELSVPHYWTMWYPWSDRIVVGGVYEEGVGECVLDKKVIDNILKHVRESIM